jgi:uncharacterized paraquat-inducible protein A
LFSQYIGHTGTDTVFCPLCPGDIKLLYIQRTKEYKCPQCGEVLDQTSRFTRRKTRLIAPNAMENQSIILSQVSTHEYLSRTGIAGIRTEKYQSPKQAWEDDSNV